MKIRESDMPKEEEWAKLFNPDVVIKLLGVDSEIRDIADFGCGYVTFTISWSPIRIFTSYSRKLAVETSS